MYRNLGLFLSFLYYGFHDIIGVIYFRGFTMNQPFIETISSVLTLNDRSLIEMDELFHFREDLKRKICTGISNLEQSLSISFSYSVQDSSDSVTIIDHRKETANQFQQQPKWMIPDENEVYTYRLSRYQHHGKKVFKFEGNKKIKLRAQSFAFDLPQSKNLFFYLTFDDYFNIESVEFVSSTKNIGKFSITKLSLHFLQFNNQFILTYYEYDHERIRDRFKLNIKKYRDRLMSLDDEIILWKLFSNTSDDVKEIIPEYYIPSAYNFKSQEFADRLKVLYMLTL